MFGFVLAAMVLTQPPAPPATRHVGAVVKVDLPARTLLLKLDAGGELWIGAPPDAEVLLTAPGERDLSKAVTASLESIGAGDRALVRGSATAGGPFVAAQIIVISQAALVRHQQAQQADWKARGIAGKVVTVSAEAGEVVIASPARQAGARVRIKVSPTTDIRRYRAGSARFSDARRSKIGELRVGDQLQAVGDQEPGGGAYLAEKIITGTFRYFVATVVAVDAAGSRLTVRAADRDAPIVVALGPGSVVRKLLPPPRRNSDLLVVGPGAFELATLERGAAVIVATVEDGPAAGPSKLVALAVIAGAEPLLKRTTEQQQEFLGSWELSLDVEAGGERGGQE